MSTNDNEPASGAHGIPPNDPHGYAALTLVESLIHVLIERCVMSTDEAVDVLETAITVQADIARIAEGTARDMWHSHTLLSLIAASLKTSAAINRIQ